MPSSEIKKKPRKKLAANSRARYKRQPIDPTQIEALKLPAGRPVEVIPEPWMYEKMAEIASEGDYVARMLVEFKICRQTFYRWLKQYPEFADAYEAARNLNQVWWEQTIKNIALTNKGNITAAAIIVNNRFKEDYQRNATGGGSDTQVNIGNVNILQNMSTDELKAEALEKMKSLGLTPQIGQTYDYEQE